MKKTTAAAIMSDYTCDTCDQEITKFRYTFYGVCSTCADEANDRYKQSLKVGGNKW